ncbi:hypothetical protein AN189_14920 [Loktanella sp. 3ANDIMAR09]|uniref:hypothetical protein n=1 Tax=Loktanella sp. 3ANDIMAR09 TaxID=1225657 RepID=UPI0006F33179|nr:hypothetical protein [Loktanella sp. 3ANDIMAR09]KQI67601.1 hypothetical protein AN189_14920 [Loktanella sp. 3ANDIMAR09]
MEASTGIEPVYTDLQSSLYSSSIKGLAPKTYQDKGSTKPEPDTAPIRPSARTNFGKTGKPRHKRAARSIAYALTQQSPDAYACLPIIFRARLDQIERAMIAWAALTSLDCDTAQEVASVALKGAGYPLPSEVDAMDDARWWAARASRQEVKAFALASFEAMPLTDRQAFLAYVSAARAAA